MNLDTLHDKALRAYWRASDIVWDERQEFKRRGWLRYLQDNAGIVTILALVFIVVVAVWRA